MSRGVIVLPLRQCLRHQRRCCCEGKLTFLIKEYEGKVIPTVFFALSEGNISIRKHTPQAQAKYNLINLIKYLTFTI